MRVDDDHPVIHDDVLVAQHLERLVIHEVDLLLLDGSLLGDRLGGDGAQPAGGPILRRDVMDALSLADVDEGHPFGAKQRCFRV